MTRPTWPLTIWYRMYIPNMWLTIFLLSIPIFTSFNIYESHVLRNAGNCIYYCPSYESMQCSQKLILACQTKCPAGLQPSAGHFEPLTDIFPSWWLVKISGHSYFPWWHFMCIEPCWTKCPARSELSAGHQQKSAGHVWHVRHISRSLSMRRNMCNVDN